MSQNTPLVSIIVPLADTPDGAQRLQCANSQSWPHCEVIPSYTSAKPSHGEGLLLSSTTLTQACNAGVQACAGDYIGLLLPGTLWTQDKTEEQISYLIWAEQPNVGVYTDIRICRPGKKEAFATMPLTGPDMLFRHVYMGRGPHVSSVLFPKAFLTPMPEIKPECGLGELMLTCAKEHTFLGLAAPLVTVFADPHPSSSCWEELSIRFLPLLFEHYGKEQATALLFEALAARRAEGLGHMATKLTQTAAQLGVRLPVFSAACLPLQPLRKPLGKLYRKVAGSLRPLLPKPALDFTAIYQGNGFGNRESRSGEGSTQLQTRILKRELPLLLRSMGIASMLDIPCGDFHWMRHVDLQGVQYVGGDIVADLAARNQQLYGNTQRSFRQINLITGPLPPADLLLCRDCLVHLPYKDILQALRTIKSSAITWLLATTFPQHQENEDLDDNGWRPTDLQSPPFRLPPPRKLLEEKCTEAGGLYKDKALGLWHRNDLAHL